MNQTEQMREAFIRALKTTPLWQTLENEIPGAAQWNGLEDELFEAFDAVSKALAAEPAKQEPCPSCRNADIYACTCPFKTARNSQPECFEPAKLVRLTNEEVSKIENRVWANTIDKGGLMALFIHRFSKAIQDAFIAKNGWK